MNLGNSTKKGRKTKRKKFIRNSSYFNTRITHKKGRNYPLTSKMNLEENVDWKSTDGAYGILLQIILIAAPCSIFLIPYNNAITNPKYWYETIFSIISLQLFAAFTFAIEIEALMSDVIKKSSTWIFLQMFLILKLGEVIIKIIIHLIWSEIMGYFEPFPLRSYLITSLSMIAVVAQAWFLIPKVLRVDPVIRKRAKAHILSGVWRMLIQLNLGLMVVVFRNISKDLQWVIALTIPLMKEIHDRITGILLAKAVAPTKREVAKFIGKISTNVVYSFWIAVIMTNDATKGTEYVLLTLNFIVNIALCYRVIRLDRQIFDPDSAVIEKQTIKKEVLTELILNEIIEVVVPIACIGSFSMAYYGPNKNILGNVGCAIWHFKKIESLSSFLMPVIKMTFLDSLSAMIAGISLWWFCRINFYAEYCKTIKKYWKVLASRGGVWITCVSNIKFGI